MISIAMATYNGEKYINEQIDSILKQTYQDFELIICDDCSTDNTVEVIIEVGRNDKRVRFYKNGERLGYIKNFEKAMHLCRGDYIALSDQDDIWEKSHLELLYKNIGENRLICSNALLVDVYNKSLNITMKEIIHIKNVPHDPLLIFQRLLYMNFAQGASMLIDRKLLDKAFPFPDEIPHDYWLAILAASESKLAYNDSISLRYRQHKNSITENKSTPGLKKIFSNKTFDQLTMLKTVFSRLEIVNDFKFFLGEAIFLYNDDNNAKEKIGKIITMFSVYKRVNFNNSISLLLYRMFKFILFKFFN